MSAFHFCSEFTKKANDLPHGNRKSSSNAFFRYLFSINMWDVGLFGTKLRTRCGQHIKDIVLCLYHRGITAVYFCSEFTKEAYILPHGNRMVYQRNIPVYIFLSICGWHTVVQIEPRRYIICDLKYTTEFSFTLYNICIWRRLCYWYYVVFAFAHICWLELLVIHTSTFYETLIVKMNCAGGDPFKSSLFTTSIIAFISIITYKS